MTENRMQYKEDNEISKGFSRVSQVLKEKDDFLITAHINSDGDSISSILLFASIVKHLGKRFLMCIDDTVPGKFDFLPDVDSIVSFEKIDYDFTPEVCVVLDASNLERIGRVNSLIPDNSTIISIDHHPSNVNFGKINVVDPKASSTSEIVYQLISALGIDVTKAMATYVYNGIVCDTGSFSFPNTTDKSLYICAEMVRCGADPGFIARMLYQRSSPDTLRALSSALSTLEFHFDGKVSCMYLVNGFVSEGSNVDTEGFVDYLLAIDGTEVEFFMIEEKPDYFRISLRSKEYVDVNAVAGEFGGGGHQRAAGCRVAGKADEVKEKLIKILESFV
ncbi:bifunctional oligoribonuclease/PAP phosphatase NrnA [bacterium]|nr:bifunctional oligoribonuclease/PAP phosphatase NrnA [bacterium]